MWTVSDESMDSVAFIGPWGPGRAHAPLGCLDSRQRLSAGSTCQGHHGHPHLESVLFLRMGAGDTGV